MRLTLTFSCLLLPLLLLSVEAQIFNTPKTIIEDSQQLGFIGSYAGISNVKSNLQFESNLLQSEALLLRNNDSIYEKISNFQGNITSSCKFNNSFYFGGEFETINQTLQVHHIVQYNTQTNQFLLLEQSLNGSVYSLYCDEIDEILYIGGNFSLNISNSTANNAISYNFKNNSWSILPWKGFNGPVYTITKNKKLNTILFGGKFDSTMDGQFFNSNTSQIVSLNSPSATISSGNGALSGLNSNPSNIVCPNKLSPEGGQPWYLQDGVPGYWDANFANPAEPTLFRLSNTHTDRGTISFNVLALGLNEYFNLSYVDLVTQQTIQCSENCTLSNDTAYQDFTVVDTLSVSGIRININSWFGAGGGLGYVQIFQSDISVHPHLTSESDAQCNPTASSTTTTVTGNWKDVYVYGYGQTVLVAEVPYSELYTSNTAIVYEPNIPSQGQYEVYATTPGCVGSSNCFTRTQVEYQLQLLPGITTTVYSDQNVYSDNRFLLYIGFISPLSSSFRPSITLRSATNATAPINGGKDVQIMADTIEFVRNVTAAPLFSILEYNLTNATLNSSAISWKPLNQQLPIGSIVYTIDASNGDTLYIGGLFATSNSSSNIISYNNELGQLIPLVSSGVNGKVSKLILSNSNLYVGGNFNTTASASTLSLRNIAQYNTAQNTWAPLGDGVDGSVNNLLLSPDNSTLTVSGLFSYRYPSSNNPIQSVGNALWSIPNNTWIERSSLIVGQIAIDDTTIIAGNILGAQTYRADLVLSSNNLNASLSIFNHSVTITAGVTWINNATNIPTTIIAAYDSDASNLTTTVYIYDNSTTSQPWRTIDSFQGYVYSLATFQNWLYVGGQFTPTQGTNQSASLVIYDLFNNNTGISVHSVTDDNNNPGIVNVIKSHPDGKRVLIGGKFTKVGILDCQTVCVIDPSTRQWNQVASGLLTGTVYDIITSNGKVTVVGDLQQNQQAAAIASVSPSDSSASNTWSISLNTNQLAGIPVTAVNSIDNEIIVAGTSSSNTSQFFVGSLNGQTYTSLASNLGQGTNISQLLLVPISSASEQRYPSGTQNMLLAVGNLNINNFGNASAALFDGNAWYPHLLTTELNGQAGIIQRVIHSTDFNGMKSARRYLSVAAVILISIAISTGILFAMSAAGLLFLSKQHKNARGPDDMPPWTPSNRLIDSLGLFGTGNLDAATLAATAAGAGAYAAEGSTTARNIAGPSKTTSRSAFPHDDAGDLGSSIFSPTTTIVPNATIPITAAAAAAGILAFDSMVASAKSNTTAAVNETHPKLFYAKYPFKAQEYGELSLDAGDTIVVTDTTDNIWWLGYKDNGSGRLLSGVFPSNYVKA